MVYSGAGFPMHCDLYVVYCTSPVNCQLSRHTLSVPAQCTAYLPKNSGTQLSPLSVSKVNSAMTAPSIREQWYLTNSPFRSKVDIALASSIYQRTVWEDVRPRHSWSGWSLASQRGGPGSMGFVVDKVAFGQVFSEYFGFLCQNRSFHQLHHPHNHPGQFAEALRSADHPSKESCRLS
jgi:hypothetical protein